MLGSCICASYGGFANFQNGGVPKILLRIKIGREGTITVIFYGVNSLKEKLLYLWKSYFMKLIERNMQTIIALCQMYKVNKLFVFGSILTERFNKESDIDLVVDFNKEDISDYFDNYYNLKDSLQEVLGREIDLLEEQAIKNPYLRKNVESSKMLIYG